MGERQTDRSRQGWGVVRQWVKPAAGLVITVGIFTWMFRPVVRNWPEVHGRIAHTSALRFVLAAAMFAAFLFVFRVLSWRRILAVWGRKLPVPASARIWSTSELARYLPGVIWQVVGRVFLVRPYGVGGATCSMSQVLELAIFLLANIGVSLACLPWFAHRMPHEARVLLYAAAGVAPLLLLLLHPRVFYGLIDGVMRLLGKPPMSIRMSGADLLGLVAWSVVGLVWQGLAIWMLMGQREALGLDLSKLGLVVGAYCLAWCAGFLAFWAPGGLGMREFVLVVVLGFALPESISRQFRDAATFNGFLAFLAVLLRLWTIAGEMILASLAYSLDYKGALGRPDAPGRVAAGETAVAVEIAHEARGANRRGDLSDDSAVASLRTEGSLKSEPA